MPTQFLKHSLLPFDVGFDLRNTGHSVRIYEGFSYGYLDRNNKKASVYPDAGAGSTQTLIVIAAVLVHAGYCVTPFTTESGQDVVVVPDCTCPGKIVWNIQDRYVSDRWCRGETLQEALRGSGWTTDDLRPLSSDEYS